LDEQSAKGDNEVGKFAAPVCASFVLGFRKKKTTHQKHLFFTARTFLLQKHKLPEVVIFR
jgi:hypothetical protein